AGGRACALAGPLSRARAWRSVAAMHSPALPFASSCSLRLGALLAALAVVGCGDDGAGAEGTGTGSSTGAPGSTSAPPGTGTTPQPSTGDMSDTLEPSTGVVGTDTTGADSTGGDDSSSGTDTAGL